MQGLRLRDDSEVDCCVSEGTSLLAERVAANIEQDRTRGAATQDWNAVRRLHPGEEEEDDVISFGPTGTAVPIDLKEGTVASLTDGEKHRIEPGEDSDSDSNTAIGIDRGPDASCAGLEAQVSQQTKGDRIENVASNENPGACFASRPHEDDQMHELLLEEKAKHNGDENIGGELDPSPAGTVQQISRPDDDGVDKVSLDNSSYTASDVQLSIPGESNDLAYQSNVSPTSPQILHRLKPGEEDEEDNLILSSVGGASRTIERLRPGEELDWNASVDVTVNADSAFGCDRLSETGSLDCSDQKSPGTEKPFCKECRGSGIDYLGKVCKCVVAESILETNGQGEHQAELDEAGFAAIQFARWAGCRWDRLHDLFNMGGHMLGESQGCSISEIDFVAYLRRHGFHGDGPNIFRAILDGRRLGDKESPKAAISDGRSLGDKTSPKDGTRLTLPQFLLFHRYASSLAAPVVEDELQSFISLLKQQRGTLLRAWRLDLDRHSVGRVTFADLAHACRKLNLSGEARPVWIALRGSESATTSLKFADIAPEETTNLNQFLDVLWEKFGFDISKAWSRIDVGGRGNATLEDFSRGARSMGFEGNAKIIFRGLDVSGKGRVRRQDLEYLKVFINPGSEAYNALRDGDPEVQSFVSWVQEVINGIDSLLSRLGLASNSAEKLQVKVSVRELAKRLQDLGYSGDALHVAVTAARAMDGAQVSAESLVALLSGKRWSVGCSSNSVTHGLSPSTPLSARSVGTPQSTSSARVMRKHACGWDNSTHSAGQGNFERCTYTRGYFSTPERGVPLRGAASFTSPVTPSPPSASTAGTPNSVQTVFTPRSRASIQPEWNSSVQGATVLDKNKSRYTRTYFSKTETLATSECEKAKAESPLSSARSSRRLTILPSRLARSGSENLLSRSAQSPLLHSPRSLPISERSRAYSARVAAGPWAKSIQRFIGIPAGSPGSPRVHPGDDSSENSFVISVSRAENEDQPAQEQCDIQEEEEEEEEEDEEEFF